MLQGRVHEIEKGPIMEYGKMTVVQLRAAAKGLGLKGASRLGKGDLLNVILEAEKSALAEAKVDQVLRPDPIDAKLAVFDAPAPAPKAKRPAPKPVEAPELEPKGAAKARRIAVEAEQNGWDVAITAGPTPGIVAFVARRGSEALFMEWDTGAFLYESHTYVIADRSVKPRNAAAARRLLARRQLDALQELGRVVQNKSFKRKAPVGGTPKASVLPFDPASATDDELKAAMAGRTVKWVNGITQTNETARVSPNGRFFSVMRNDGGTIIQFLDPRTGFRALRLSALLSVGRK